MINLESCPVPKEQIPSLEFAEICNSFFFSLAQQNRYKFYTFLFHSWLLFLPFFMTIVNESYSLQKELLKFSYITLCSSMSIPIIFVLRQLILKIKKALFQKEHESPTWMNALR